MVSYTFTLDNFEYWLLIFVRIVSFLVTAPFFSQTGVPNRTKVGFALFVSLIMFNVAERPPFDYSGVVGYGVTALGEGITGLLLGMAANICNSIILFAGSIIDMDIGLSMATEFNPDMKTEMTLTGNLYYYLVFLLLITSNMLGYLVRAISDSFSVIPIGHPQFNWDHLVGTMVRYMGDLFVLGFRIFLPFFTCIMILNCILGIMAKVAPQMNMFAVGMQLKIIVGYLVLFLVIYLLPNVAEIVFTEIRSVVVDFAEGMY